ncbi:MAG: M23 family metallopeptidase [Burkholderiales bacterium]|nr:M23 family metallopeptidase [Burkholderiales bacterium]
MHIIVFAHRLASPRSVTLTARHVMVGAALVILTVLASAALMYFATLKYVPTLRVPLLHSLLRSVQEDEARRNEEFLRQNLNAMAVKLGEMQAQLMRLDALGERVSGLAGVKLQEFRPAEPPGRGGAAVAPMRDLTLSEFARELEKLAKGVESRADFLNIAESELFHAKLKSKRLPTALPVDAEFNASGFGQRIDPITGQSAMHEGIDFIAPQGSPIVAAAGGVVIAAEWHHSFGNMIEVDHGGEIVTRYAHCASMLVKPGDIVRRGQKIAEVGSTGRSTGAHLHFEVRYRGQAQDPAKFLLAGQRAGPGPTASQGNLTAKSR